MNTTLRIGLMGTLLAALVGTAAAELIPTPEFSTHQIPTTSVQEAEAISPALDIAILLLALILATCFSLVLRSRRALWLLTLGSLLWFGFYRQGCVCAIGATQNVALAIFDPSYAIPLAAVAFFVLPLLFTLFFGRTFCGSVCPLGAIQELTAVRPLQVPGWLDQSLGLVAFVYLGAAAIFAATGTAFIICRYDPFVAFFRLSGSPNMLIFGASLLMIGLFVARPYCRYLCPYGAVLRVLAAFSKWRVRISPTECINCRLCETACPYGAIDHPTPEQAEASRVQGKRRLGWTLLLAPLLISLLALVGASLEVPLSRWDAQVRLGEQVRLEQLGQAAATDASDAFRATGTSPAALFASAVERRIRFRWLGGLLGAWVGLVASGKLIQLSLRRHRDDFQADRGRCISCGRCYWYCPVEQVRLGLIADVGELVTDPRPGQEQRR